MPETRVKQTKTNGGGRRVNDGFSGVDAVERALSMLDAFSDGTPALALKELADRTGLTKSTILRLNVSLERFGYLVRDSDGNYRLGPTLWQLGALFRQNLDLREVVVPVLERLVAETKESASFYVLRGKSGVCLYRVNSPRLARDHVEEGEIIPLGLGGFRTRSSGFFQSTEQRCGSDHPRPQLCQCRGTRPRRFGHLGSGSGTGPGADWCCLDLGTDEPISQ